MVEEDPQEPKLVEAPQKLKLVANDQVMEAPQNFKLVEADQVKSKLRSAPKWHGSAHVRTRNSDGSPKRKSFVDAQNKFQQDKASVSSGGGSSSGEKRHTDDDMDLRRNMGFLLDTMAWSGPPSGPRPAVPAPLTRIAKVCSWAPWPTQRQRRRQRQRQRQRPTPHPSTRLKSIPEQIHQ